MICAGSLQSPTSPPLPILRTRPQMTVPAVNLFSTALPPLNEPRGGLLVVAPRGRILFIGHQVTRLLKQYFPPRPHSRSLPEPLARWIASRDPDPLCWEKDGRRLIVSLRDRSVKDARCYLVREAGPELSSFIPREISILYWLVMGKTNVEIGLIRGLATTTIKKYLEPIYQKLSVETRLATALNASKFFPD